MRTTVVVPTFKRPTDLRRCLMALKHQISPPHEVIVVVREDDAETWSALAQVPAEALPLQTQTINVPGVVAAMNLGMGAATGDIVAFTDDDAAPHPDWIQRMQQHFAADPRLGGLGGRDLVQHEAIRQQPLTPIVGKLQWFGRVVGDHHRGSGAAREVDVLKGVNMSFRRQAIENLSFDTRMLGRGAQVHFELAFSLTLKRSGWKLVYDPQLLVDHHVAQRFDEDQRHSFNRLAYRNAVHNETLALLDHLPTPQRLVFCLWSNLIGTRQAFGLLQWLRFLPAEKGMATDKLLAAWEGRSLAWTTWQQSRQNQRPRRLTPAGSA